MAVITKKSLKERIDRALAYGHEDEINQFLIDLEYQDMFWKMFKDLFPNEKEQEALIKKYEQKIFE